MTSYRSFLQFVCWLCITKVIQIVTDYLENAKLKKEESRNRFTSPYLVIEY